MLGKFINPVEVLNFSDFYIRNCINCVHNCEDHSLLDFTSAVQYMKCFIYNFKLIPHRLIGTHKWPAPNISGFIPQLVRALHQYHKVMVSNPVEVLNFSGFHTQLQKLRTYELWGSKLILKKTFLAFFSPGHRDFTVVRMLMWWFLLFTQSSNQTSRASLILSSPPKTLRLSDNYFVVTFLMSFVFRLCSQQWLQTLAKFMKELCCKLCGLVTTFI